MLYQSPFRRKVVYCALLALVLTGCSSWGSSESSVKVEIAVEVIGDYSFDSKCEPINSYVPEDGVVTATFPQLAEPERQVVGTWSGSVAGVCSFKGEVQIPEEAKTYDVSVFVNDEKQVVANSRTVASQNTIETTIGLTTVIRGILEVQNKLSSAERETCWEIDLTKSVTSECGRVRWTSSPDPDRFDLYTVGECNILDTEPMYVTDEAGSFILYSSPSNTRSLGFTEAFDSIVDDSTLPCSANFTFEEVPQIKGTYVIKVGPDFEVSIPASKLKEDLWTTKIKLD